MKRDADEQRVRENATPGFENAMVIAGALTPKASTTELRRAALVLLAQRGEKGVEVLRNELDRIAAQLRQRDPKLTRDDARARALLAFGDASLAPAARTASTPERESLDVKAERNADPAFSDAFVIVKAANPLTRSTTALRHLASVYLAQHGDAKVTAQRAAVEQLATDARRADASIGMDTARERGLERARSIKPELFK